MADKADIVRVHLAVEDALRIVRQAEQVFRCIGRRITLPRPAVARADDDEPPAG
jgi:hypothetical protein